MIIHSKNNMPRIYATSRDYQAIQRLLDVITNVEKSDVDNLVSLVNADMCPSKYLPLLATFVGYDYDYSLSYEANRLIIKYYPLMIRLRGSEEGIVLACAVALNSSDALKSITGAMNYINVIYDEENAILKIFINSTVPPKLYELIEVVRPVGMSIKIMPSQSVRPKEEIRISDVVSVGRFEVHTSNRYYVMPGSSEFIALTTEPDGWDVFYTYYYEYDNGAYVRLKHQETPPTFTIGSYYKRDVNEVGFGEINEPNA